MGGKLLVWQGCPQLTLVLYPAPCLRICGGGSPTLGPGRRCTRIVEPRKCPACPRTGDASSPSRTLVPFWGPSVKCTRTWNMLSWPFATSTRLPVPTTLSFSAWKTTILRDPKLAAGTGRLMAFRCSRATPTTGCGSSCGTGACSISSTNAFAATRSTGMC